MLCRYELKDPRKCLKEGKEVTKCAIEGFQDIKKHCGSEFQTHVDCVINTSSTATNDQRCSKTRQVFDDCMLKNLNLERPPFGYFCEAKVHDSPRPKTATRKIWISRCIAWVNSSTISPFKIRWTWWFQYVMLFSRIASFVV